MHYNQIMRIAGEVDDARILLSGRQRLQWLLAIAAVGKTLVREN